MTDLYRPMFLPDLLIAALEQNAPKSVDIVDAIPLSAVGKPDKKALRSRYWAATDRMVN